MTELKANNLIEEERLGKGQMNKIFILEVKCNIKNTKTKREKTTSLEVKNVHIKKCKNYTSRSEEATSLEVKNVQVKKCNNFTSGSEKTTSPCINKTEYNQTEYNNTELTKQKEQFFYPQPPKGGLQEKKIFLILIRFILNTLIRTSKGFGKIPPPTNKCSTIKLQNICSIIPKQNKCAI
jgi:hypothetical protein